MRTEDLMPAQRPPLLTDERIVGLSTDTKPTNAEGGGELQVGTEFVCEDTGVRFYWTGSAWAGTTFPQVITQGVDLLIEIRDLLRTMTAEG